MVEQTRRNEQGKSSPDELVGRDEDLARVNELLDAGVRLVTISGPPGIGKTRLAREIARQGGVLILLSGSRTIDDVMSSVGAAIGVPTASSGREALAERVASAIGQTDQLLVLDNFEHIASLAGETIGRWTTDGGNARFLVTSREVLRLQSEWVHELRPLSLQPGPDGESDAVRLLRLRVQRSSGSEPGAAPDRIADLTEVARALDGIPLALELAAQRVAMFGASAVRARLGSFLDFLADGRRGAPVEKRTLRDTIAWSWSLLDAHEQVALAQCSVFCGSFDLDAAERVLSFGGDAAAVLQALREKSLVATAEGDATRFRLLLPIREFARERLAADDAVATRRRHAEYFLARSERLLAGARGAGHPALLADLERDRDDLGAVIEQAWADDCADTLRRAIRATAPLVLARGPIQPLLDTLDDVLGEGDGPDRAELGLLRGRLLRRVGRIGEAEALFAGALERGDAAAPYLHGELAYCKFSTGRVVDALADWTRARETRAAASSHDRVGEGTDMVRMAFALRELGRYDEAELLAAEALAIGRRARSPVAQATALAILSVVASDRGLASRALLLAQEASAEAAAARSSYHQAIALSAVAVAHLVGGELVECEAVLHRCRRLLGEIGFSRLEAGALLYLGVLSWERGDLNAARGWLDDAIGIYRTLDDPRYTGLAVSVLGAMDAHEGSLGLAERRFAALPPSDGLPLSRAIEIHRLHLDVALARQAEAAGRLEEAARRREQVRQELAAEPRAYDERVARRLCLGALTHGAVALEVRAQGTRCRLGQTIIELGKHQAARAVLSALIRGRQERPAQPLGWEELVRDGWPAERMLPAAAKNRLKVTIAWLRKAGFRDLIASDGRGYWIRPNTRVVVDPS